MLKSQGKNSTENSIKVNYNEKKKIKRKDNLLHSNLFITAPKKRGKLRTQRKTKITKKGKDKYVSSAGRRPRRRD